MLYQGRKWLSLGAAGAKLGVSRKRLWRQIRDGENIGFTILEKIDADDRVWRYLPLDEIEQTMRSNESIARRKTKRLRWK